MTVKIHATITVPIAKLKEHPRNYRDHPDDQLEHIAASITEHGFYRNIVVAKDLTILAGHGVVKAASEKLGLTEVPVIKLNVGPNTPKALKVLTGDNELSRLAGIDDRLLSELLREVYEDDPTALLGTGYDEAMLASLVLVTRPTSEIANPTEAAQWVGMPEFENNDKPFQLLVSFDSEADRDKLLKEIGVEPRIATPGGKCWSLRWPDRPREDVKSVAFLPGAGDAS